MSSREAAAPEPIRQPPYGVLYHACLDYWRRTHAELQLVTRELAAADASVAVASRAAGLSRVLLLRRTVLLQRALSCWTKASVQLELRHAVTRGSTSLRQERATVKELEAQLAAAQEAESASRQQWTAERQQWLAERREWERRQREQEDAAAAALESELSSTRRRAAAPDERLPTTAQAPAEAARAPALQAPAFLAGQRPLGACAQRLLAAWDGAEMGGGAPCVGPASLG
jgi:hypothetical protein